MGKFMIKKILSGAIVSAALIFILPGFQARAQTVEADPQTGPQAPPPSYQPPPGQPPPSQPPPGQPPPDQYVPQGPVQANPEPGYPGYYARPPRRYWNNPPPFVENWADESRFRVNVEAFYNFAGTGYSSNATEVTNGFSGQGGLSADMDNAAGFAAEVFMAQPFGWGFDAGLSYDLVRNINDFNDPSTTIYYTGSKPTIQFTTLYGNAVFRRQIFYLPLGLNYTIPTFSGGANNGALTSTTVTGNVGFQFGIGFLLGRRFSIELMDRILHFQATSSNNNVSVNWGDVYLSGLQLNLKFSLL